MQYSRIGFAPHVFSACSIVTMLPRDLLIFCELIVTIPVWTHILANCLRVYDSDWAISFSWCGKTRSCPPPWISIVSPRYLRDMAEHSICQPGLPFPQGLDHVGSSE